MQNQTEDSIRKELIALQEDKHNYETTAKESLRRVLQEKIEVVRKLSEVEVLTFSCLFFWKCRNSCNYSCLDPCFVAVLYQYLLYSALVLLLDRTKIVKPLMRNYSFSSSLFKILPAFKIHDAVLQMLLCVGQTQGK